MRNKQARTALALALVVASVAALGSLAGPVSPASAATWRHATDYLHFPPWQQRGECLLAYWIELNGTYHWRAFTTHWAHPRNPAAHSRRVRLRGLYKWFVCRDHLRTGYRIRTAITNSHTGGTVYLEHHEFGGRYGDGNYDWGSTIERRGPFGR
jgi:hypothetical protein